MNERRFSEDLSGLPKKIEYLKPRKTDWKNGVWGEKHNPIIPDASNEGDTASNLEEIKKAVAAKKAARKKKFGG